MDDLNLVKTGITPDWITFSIEFFSVDMTKGGKTVRSKLKVPASTEVNIAVQRHAGASHQPDNTITLLEFEDMIRQLRHTVEDALEDTKGDW